MNVIVVFLPFLAIIFLWRRRLDGWRNTVLTAAVVWGGCLVVMTEILSLGSHITAAWLMTGWIIVLVGVVIATKWIPLIQPVMSSPPPDDKLLVWALGPQLLAIIVITAIVGWMGPPNNWDAMTYHMPRVLHWMQDRNVAFYPLSSNLRQLLIAPASEYIFLHLEILTGSDRPVALVQWFAYCGCIIEVSLLAELLGAERFGQQLASLAVATLPIACLESESSQNDVIASFWMLCVVILIVRLCKMAPMATKNAFWFESAICGVALGLALLTKATANIFMVPFLLGLTGILLWKMKSKALAPLAMLALIAIAINVPTYARNHRFNHTFLGNGGTPPGGPDLFANKPLGWRTASSTFIRNCALELATPSSNLCGRLERVVRKIHRWLKIDPDDPNTTYLSLTFHVGDWMWHSEDGGPNPIHFVLAFITGLILWLKAPRDKGGRLAALFGFGIFLAYTAFCSYFRWQPWNNRYHMPLMVMSCAVMAIAFERYFNRRLISVLFGIMSLFAVAVVANNFNHPLVGDWNVFNWDRESRYFLLRPHLQGSFRYVVDAAEKMQCRQVGLIVGGDDWEYPLDMMLRARLPDIRIEPYPQAPWQIWDSKRLHTSNPGWDENLRPYMVVSIQGDVVSIVKTMP